MKNSTINHVSELPPPIVIEEWTKTAGYIFALPVEGEEIVIHRGLFEAWVDKKQKRECGSIDGGTQTMCWDEYYSSEFIDSDIAEYLTCKSACEDVLKNINLITKA